MGEEIKLGISILIYLISLIGVYYKMKYDIKKCKEDIESTKDSLKEHCLETPKCQKKFEDIKLDIQKLQTEDKSKETYQLQIIEHLVRPIIKEMSDSLRDYTDIKTGILTKEIESLRIDSNIFKQEIKQLVKDITAENNKNIERLIEVLNKK